MAGDALPPPEADKNLSGKVPAVELVPDTADHVGRAQEKLAVMKYLDEFESRFREENIPGITIKRTPEGFDIFGAGKKIGSIFPNLEKIPDNPNMFFPEYRLEITGRSEPLGIAGGGYTENILREIMKFGRLFSEQESMNALARDGGWKFHAQLPGSNSDTAFVFEKNGCTVFVHPYNRDYYDIDAYRNNYAKKNGTKNIKEALRQLASPEYNAQNDQRVEAAISKLQLAIRGKTYSGIEVTYDSKQKKWSIRSSAAYGNVDIGSIHPILLERGGEYEVRFRTTYVGKKKARGDKEGSEEADSIPDILSMIDRFTVAKEALEKSALANGWHVRIEPPVTIIFEKNKQKFVVSPSFSTEGFSMEEDLGGFSEADLNIYTLEGILSKLK